MEEAKEAIENLAIAIGNNNRPRSAAIALFPHKPKYYVANTRKIYLWCTNQLAAHDCYKNKSDRWKEYEKIADGILELLPKYALDIIFKVLYEEKGE